MASVRNQLAVGGSLQKNESLTTKNGKFRLINQDDGNFVLYDKENNNRVLWASNTSGSGACRITMQADGKLVMTAESSNQVKWSNGKSATPGTAGTTSFILKENGNAVIMQNGQQTWDTGTGRWIQTNKLEAGDAIAAGQSLISLNGKYKFAVEDQRGFVLTDLHDDNETLWEPNDRRSMYRATRLQATLQLDGNLVLKDAQRASDSRSYMRGYDDDNSNDDEQYSGMRGSRQENGKEKEKDLWTSNTAGNANAVLTMQDDGNVTITAGGKQIWSTLTATRQTPQPPGNNKDTMFVGQLYRRSFDDRESPNGKFKAKLDYNVFIVQRENGKQLWTGTGSGEKYSVRGMKLRCDGELQMLNDSRQAIWSSGTAGKGNTESVIKIQDDGELVLVTDGKIVWRAGSALKIDTNAPKRDRLRVGERLEWDQSLNSPNGRFRFTLQDDGNCVLYDGSKAIWATNTTAGARGTALVVQFDDNVVLERNGWSTNTRRCLKGGNASLILLDSGALTLVSQGEVIWSNQPQLVNASLPAMTSIRSGVSRMNRGEFLAPNQFLQSSNGQYLASLQSNGILAIRHKSSNVVLWTSNRTINTAATMLALQYDRNLVILAGKTPIWSSDTANDEGDSTLVLKDDGNLELSDTRWSTGFKFPALYGPIKELKFNESLLLGQTLTSANGKYTLALTTDGHISISSQGQNPRYYYNAASYLEPVDRLTFGRPGSSDSLGLHVQNGSGKSLWSSKLRQSRVAAKAWEDQMEYNQKARAASELGYVRGSNTKQFVEPSYEEPRFTLQDDGVAVVWSLNDVVWSTDERPNGPTTQVCTTITVGNPIRPGGSIYSKSLQFRLNFQQDGNLVLYKDGELVWASDVYKGTTQHSFVEQARNGRLIVYDKDGLTAWQTPNTLPSEANGVYPETVLQDDGNLVTKMGNSVLWSRK